MRRAFLAVIVLALAFMGAGCPCVRSAVNASLSYSIEIGDADSR